MSKDPIQNFFHNEEVFVTGATGIYCKNFYKIKNKK